MASPLDVNDTVHPSSHTAIRIVEPSSQSRVILSDTATPQSEHETQSQSTDTTTQQHQSIEPATFTNPVSVPSLPNLLHNKIATFADLAAASSKRVIILRLACILNSFAALFLLIWSCLALPYADYQAFVVYNGLVCSLFLSIYAPLAFYLSKRLQSREYELLRFAVFVIGALLLVASIIGLTKKRSEFEDAAFVEFQQLNEAEQQRYNNDFHEYASQPYERIWQLSIITVLCLPILVFHLLFLSRLLRQIYRHLAAVEASTQSKSETAMKREKRLKEITEWKAKQQHRKERREKRKMAKRMSQQRTSGNYRISEEKAADECNNNSPRLRAIPPTEFHSNPSRIHTDIISPISGRPVNVMSPKSNESMSATSATDTHSVKSRKKISSHRSSSKYNSHSDRKKVKSFKGSRHSNDSFNQLQFANLGELQEEKHA